MHFDNINLYLSITGFIISLIVLLIIYQIIIKQLKKRVHKTPGKLDDFLLDLLRIPILWLMFWILVKIFSYFFLDQLSFFNSIKQLNNILLILSIAWISIQVVRAAAFYVQNKNDITIKNNLHARKTITQVKVFQRIANTLIIIIAVSLSLLTFDKARTIGLSLLTSAGIIGIIVGFAAQKSIGMFLAGIQIAITQPIRIDDVVIVENEWGRIEEITLTYVVVKIWDERRMILPVTYFLETPFQNWTRTTADIMGSVFIYVGFDFPVNVLREQLPALLKDNPNWDGRVANIQVTKLTEFYKELRVLVSSADASMNWDLRVALREQLTDYIATNYPDTFAQVRLAVNNGIESKKAEIKEQKHL